MGFWQSIMGRSQPKAADLDALFLVPSAAVTLETALGLRAMGRGSVCFRSAAGPAFTGTREELLALSGEPDRPGDVSSEVTVSTDSFGFTWVEVSHDTADVSGLCTRLHAVNSTLAERGFGTGLLCSLVPFVDAHGGVVGLVYLYKQGTFYAFAPRHGQARDNLLEIQVRDALAAELPMEQDLARWLALWGAPGMSSTL